MEFNNRHDPAHHPISEAAIRSLKVGDEVQMTGGWFIAIGFPDCTAPAAFLYSPP